MKVRMLASAILSPSFTLLVEGDTYDISKEDGAMLCAAGLAVPVPASPETMVKPPNETMMKPLPTVGKKGVAKK